MTSLLSHWLAAVCGGKDHFLCASGICVPQKLVCNGYNDCDDWSDETHCGETHTNTHTHACTRTLGTNRRGSFCPVVVAMCLQVTSCVECVGQRGGCHGDGRGFRPRAEECAFRPHCDL